MQIVQLRSTIFISQNIGYTPETAAEFKTLLEPEGHIRSLVPPGIPVQGVSQEVPQWGMPWCIYKQRGTDSVYTINFLPGKIDFILNKEVDPASDTEVKFLELSKSWVEKICAKIADTVVRVAYAPFYAILDNENTSLNDVKAKVIPLKAFAGQKPQDINVSFNYKNQIKISDKTLHTNLLCNISDGYKTIHNKNTEHTQNVLMVQLDINTIPSMNYKLTPDEVAIFFSEVLNLKDQLLNTILK